MKVYNQPEQILPVFGEFDVAVIGAGPSGCAAAIAAARHGAKTVLIEKNGFVGGAVVSQDVSVILSTNGVDFQGIWHEFMTCLKSFGGVVESEFIKNGANFVGAIDPELVKHSWEKLLKDANVQMLYNACVSGAIVENNSIYGVTVTDVSGNEAIFAKRVIDCSGDGIVSLLAGASWNHGNENGNSAMALTKVIRIGNVEYDAGPKDNDELERIKTDWENAVKSGEYDNPIVLSGRVLDYIGVKKILRRVPRYRREVLLFTSRVLNVNPVSSSELSEAEIIGREQALQVADFYKKYVPGFENSYIVSTNYQIGVRSSRRIVGIMTASEDDAVNFTKYSDGVAKCSWNIDIWPADSYTAKAVDKSSPKAKERIEKLNSGEYFDIRYGCLVSKDINNLLIAGRIVSSDHIAQSALRIQQTCISTGQAAGVAAALSISEGIDAKDLDTNMLVSVLEKDRLVKPAFDVLL